MIWTCDVAVCGVRQVTSHSPYARSCSTEQSEDFTPRSRTIYVVPGVCRARFLEYLPVLLYFLSEGSRGFCGGGGGGGGGGV